MSLTPLPETNPFSMLTCLSRVSPQTYHLINPNQPEDVHVYEAGQLHQCLTFDAHLRSIRDSNNMGPILAPAGYKDLARILNESHEGPERFSTFERQQNGSVELCIDGLAVTSELLGLESASLPDGRDSENELSEDINAYVIVEMPEAPDAVSPVRERIEQVKDLAQELNKFYHARAKLEEEYSLGLFRLSDQISAHHRNASSGELQACMSALLRETDKQAVTHCKLSTDIRKEADNILTRFTESNTELEQIMTSLGHTLSENVLRASTIDASATSVIYSPQDIEFRTRVVKLQEKNLSTVNEVMWAYANHISTACVADDEACEAVRLALEKLVPSEEAGKVILEPDFPPVQAGGSSVASSPSPTPAASTPPANQETQGGQTNTPSQFLFHVRALFDYEPVDDGDLRLEEGDRIGVTVISDDGWWKGMLLTGPRRGAVGMVPSNFVTTQNVNPDL